MEIKFIGQGFGNCSSEQTGNVILDALSSGVYNSFVGFSAFVSVGGINNLLEELQGFVNKGNKVHLYVGVDLHGTSKEALDLLLKEKIPTTVVYSPNTIVYHPKVYVFKGPERHMIIVGSSNLTASGLFQNIESSICLSFAPDDIQGRNVEGSISAFFEAITTGSSESAKPLSQILLEILASNNIVLSETTTRQVGNNLNGSLPKVTCENRERLKAEFKRIVVSRPPKGYMKLVRGEVVTTPRTKGEDSTVVCNSVLIEGRSMWIESGRMTGGSRNILDLSKQGRRDGITKFGSVEFFDIDKEEYTTEKDITLIYNGKEYVGNTIKYAHRNSNWRIQLKGVADSEDRFTEILRASGSQNKVFIFEKTGDALKYKFHILDADDMDMLKDMSLDWTSGGKGGTGRQYGIIDC